MVSRSMGIFQAHGTLSASIPMNLMSVIAPIDGALVEVFEGRLFTSSSCLT